MQTTAHTQVFSLQVFGMTCASCSSAGEGVCLLLVVLFACSRCLILIVPSYKYHSHRVLTVEQALTAVDGVQQARVALTQVRVVCVCVSVCGVSGTNV